MRSNLCTSPTKKNCTCSLKPWNLNPLEIRPIQVFSFDWFCATYIKKCKFMNSKGCKKKSQFCFSHLLPILGVGQQLPAQWACSFGPLPKSVLSETWRTTAGAVRKARGREKGRACKYHQWNILFCFIFRLSCCITKLHLTFKPKQFHKQLF